MIEMKNTLYSMMLSDDVVREVDVMANRLGMTRSALVNRILAEYVGFQTPERRIGEILDEVEQLLQPVRELAPFFVPNASSFSLKSALQYKYRPTVRYEVQLYDGHPDALGQLSVQFRTQSAALTQVTAAFFLLWKDIENRFLDGAVTYDFSGGKLVRTLQQPKTQVSVTALARAISEYIQLFDRCMKAYICTGCTPAALMQEYAAYVRSSQQNDGILL